MMKRWTKRRLKLLKHKRIWLWGAPALHHMLLDAPKPDFEKIKDTAPVPDALLHRIQSAFKGSHGAYKGGGVTLWDEITARQKPFIDALSADTIDDLREIFTAFYSTEHAEGFAIIDEAIWGRWAWKEGFPQIFVTDLLLSLAEAISVLPAPSFGQMKAQAYADFVATDQAQLLADVEKRLGFSLAAPLIGQPPLARIGETLTTATMISHAYVVHRMGQLGIGKDAAILEIGGGLGYLALLAARAGHTRYTIIDLPYVNAMQAFFLGTALTEDAIRLAEEDGPGTVSLLPPPAIKTLPDKSLDLVINIDSLPEMSEEVCRDYLHDIRRTANLFLSINQESQGSNTSAARQNWVAKLADEIPGFRRLHRHRYWMNEGYVEELYALDG